MVIRVDKDDRALMARLGAMPDRVKGSLRSEVQSLAFDLQSLVKRKVSGEVLNVQTGFLRSHIFEEVTDDSRGVIGQVFTSGVKYAAVHEYGGAGWYEIRPRNGEFLRWMSGGQEVFARVVNHPPAKERSFMRSSLRDMRAEIIERMRGAVVQGTRK